MHENFFVRPALLTDADAIAAVHVDSIHSLGAETYPAEVISAWGHPRDGERYRQAMKKGELFFIALTSDKVAAGFSSYRVENNQHRIAVYVSANAARSGVGTELYKQAEKAARAGGAREIHNDASLVAVPFYARQGFEVQSTGMHRLSNGSEMACVFMKKTL